MDIIFIKQKFITGGRISAVMNKKFLYFILLINNRVGEILCRKISVYRY